MLPDFSYLYTKPDATGDLRTEMADFKVFERLPFSPCGEGEHVFVHIEKTGQNTVYVARELAKYFGVKEQLVSYAGLKDRFAVTQQWFGIHVPGKKTFDLTDLAIEGVKVLSVSRHNKKLRTGALSGNRFELTLKNVSNIDDVVRRWHTVCEHGVPNYFGEQRFGINGGNIEHAESLFSGTKVKDKKKRGIYLSAARSLIFNSIVSQRIDNNTFDKVSEGDVMMLAGTQSIFVADSELEKLGQRLIEKDIDLTAPMWGAGELKTEASIADFEQSCAEKFSSFTLGLGRFGLKQERRKIRLCLEEGDLAINEDTLVLSFFLPSGSYATTILREIINYQDLTVRAV